MQLHDSRAVSNKILEMGKAKDISFSTMKLIKLVYFSHGWCLAISDTPLVDELAEAWKYGPVFRKLYNSISAVGSNLINDPICDLHTNQVFESNFNSTELKIMNRVLDVYGSLGAFELSDITHLPDSPWTYTFNNSGEFSPINNLLIKNYFTQEMKARKQ